ncbi:5-formyltetrahydrofolate cyclo-ligase [Paenibacillus typhae]|uniref:5-formyltetrahydrofolate cyclo-ligase n=1 Tax=Paenibacillus typhae TaxID=1174501 RepID=UPI001C8DDE30|nr:5-formyltetrahydrofolate cyclo-ligase [Paenibacillus typhae]MBY0014470.1 5-formyltetrahydrofolate cyclo-ligase [Paenibacillus typhae]
MTGQSALTAERKRELRAAAAAARGKLPADQRNALSSLVCRHAAERLAGEEVKTLLAYVPFRSELDTRPLIAGAWAEGCKVLLPRVIQATGMMSLHPVHSWKELVPGAFGILEPAADSADRQERLPRPDVIFVPGLAFDRRGGRLGYGRGYYDRLRATLDTEAAPQGKDPLWIGLAFGRQVVEEVPMDDHDAYMDLLITEEGVMDCRRERQHGI